jgi:hypothetical protein
MALLGNLAARGLDRRPDRSNHSGDPRLRSHDRWCDRQRYDCWTDHRYTDDCAGVVTGAKGSILIWNPKISRKPRYWRTYASNWVVSPSPGESKV